MSVEDTKHPPAIETGNTYTAFSEADVREEDPAIGIRTKEIDIFVPEGEMPPAGFQRLFPHRDEETGRWGFMCAKVVR